MENSKIDSALDEMLKSINFLIKETLKTTTQIYNGTVISFNSGNKWNIQYNGEVHSVEKYGNNTPVVGSVVKVFIPQGNQNLAWFLC